MLEKSYEESYEKKIVVSQYECDMFGRMTLAYILRYAQQISTDHCDHLGLTSDVFQKTSTAFLLSKISVEIKSPPVFSREILIKTEPALPRRAVYNRFTRFLDKEGAELLSVDARWVLVDTKSRRILRRPPEGLELPFVSSEVPTHDCVIEKADTLNCCSEERVTYSKIDVNGHLNNTFYADFICDCLPLEALKESFIKKLVIAYHHELLLGQRAKIYLGQTQTPGKYYICGKNQDNIAFEANIIL